MSLEGKNMAIHVEADFEDDELTSPLQAMRDAGSEVIIVPGGYPPDKMCLHQPMIDLVRKAYAKGKIITAICRGPQFLISAEIVKGCRVASWPSVAINLKNAGAIWVSSS